MWALVLFLGKGTVCVSLENVYLQFTMKYNLGFDVSGNDWIGQNAGKLFSDVYWVDSCHLYIMTLYMWNSDLHCNNDTSK